MSVVANVAINIDGKQAASILDEIKKKVEAMNGAFDKVPQAKSGVDGLASNLVGLAAKVATVATVTEVVRKSLNAAFERGQAETRLKALTSAYGETAEATSLAAAASDKFGLTQTEATKAIGDVYGRLRPLGFSLKEISGVYDGFNTLTMQAGLSSAEASSVFTQLSQALGSGTLRGDEFNRMAESMPAILGVVSKELGVSQTALRGMAADGKISADVVVRGLKKVADAGGNLDDFLDPSTKAMNELAKNTEDAQVAFGNLLKPAAVAILNGLSKALELTVKNLKQIAQTAVFFAAFAGTLKLIALGTEAWAVASKALAAGQKAAGIAAAFLQGVINPASLAKTALALGAATGASVLLGKAMDSAAEDAAKIDPEVQKAAKAATAAEEAAKKMKAELEKVKETAKELAIEMQTKVVAAAKAASDEVERLAQRQDSIGTIVNARIGAEQKLNELQKVGLERDYERAATAQRRFNIAVALFKNEVNAAALQYQSAKASILIDNERVKLQQQSAILKGYEIIAEGKLQILQAKTVEEENKKRQALGEALIAQNNVIKATAAQGVAQQIANGYQLSALDSQYKMQVAAAGTALQQKLVSDKIGLSANAANNLTQGMVSAATSTQTMTNISADLTGKLNQAATAIDNGTSAAVQNVQLFDTAAVASAQSQDKWRESVLKGIEAQRQVAVEVQQTSEKVVAANNIRATASSKADATTLDSSRKTNAEIAKANGFAVSNITKDWTSFANKLPSLMNSLAASVKTIFGGIGSSIKAVLNSVTRAAFNSVNAAIDRINSIIRGANAISKKAGGPQFGQLNRLSIPAFAEGGIVKKPTMAMVGDGGEPEYIIPQSKMAAASANYLSGARGASVIPSGNAQINVTTGPVMQQGGQQYVSMADLEKAMRKTADGIYSSLRTPAGRYATGVR